MVWMLMMVECEVESGEDLSSCFYSSKRSCGDSGEIIGVSISVISCTSSPNNSVRDGAVEEDEEDRTLSSKTSDGTVELEEEEDDVLVRKGTDGASESVDIASLENGIMPAFLKAFLADDGLKDFHAFVIKEGKSRFVMYLWWDKKKA